MIALVNWTGPNTLVLIKAMDDIGGIMDEIRDIMTLNLVVDIHVYTLHIS